MWCATSVCLIVLSRSNHSGSGCTIVSSLVCRTLHQSSLKNVVGYITVTCRMHVCVPSRKPSATAKTMPLKSASWVISVATFTVKAVSCRLKPVACHGTTPTCLSLQEPEMHTVTWATHTQSQSINQSSTSNHTTIESHQWSPSYGLWICIR